MLAAALILDALLGEPDALWRRIPHPAVLMGRSVGWLDARLNLGTSRRARGAVTLAVLVLGWWLLAALIAALPFGSAWEVAGAAILLAQRSLTDHVADVARGLRASLAEGRAQVAKIVGRDPAALDGTGVARGAIESAAENFSDGVVAPAFWFLIFGLPGIVVYKAVNTADSMIGYRNERYGEFGWAAARLDDALNWIPARLSAVLICVARGGAAAWAVVRRDARLHRSPNAGW
ncbi:adenosylcobinamide-phosphate synthase CbiB, partial [bacterium]|nr:adenosylcobinamide-phosphate synthase CbiB [bacterium]